MRCRLCLLLTLLLCGGATPLAAVTPHLVKDVNTAPQGESSVPHDFVKVGGLVYFSADDGISGNELWRTDGTLAGTFRLTDVCPEGCTSQYYFMGRSDHLYFFRAGGLDSGELWVTDGTPAGTLSLNAIVRSPGVWVASQRLFYFAAEDDVHGLELWRSDGTPGGTFLVSDLRPGPAGSFFFNSFVEFKGKVFFLADDGRGPSLWTSDGTAQGTRLVRNLAPSVTVQDQQPFFGVVGQALVFTGQTPSQGLQLWRSDGTAKGTVAITSLKPRPFVIPFVQFTVFGSRLFFVADTKGSGQELWVTDATAQGTKQLTNFPFVEAFFDTPSQRGFAPPAPLGKHLIFAANDGPHGAELWTTDGTPRGTVLVKDVCPGACSGAAGSAALGGNLFYFAGTDGVHGQEPWVSDGTAKGTRMIGDLCQGSCNSFPLSFTSAGAGVYFLALDGANGVQLWHSDAAGTLPLTTNVLSFGQFPDLKGVVVGSSLVFAARNAESGFEPWSSDGTARGTGLLADLNTMDQGGSEPVDLTAAGNKADFFAQSNGESGIWTSDGTGAGTTELARLPPSVSDFYSDLTELAGTRFFLVRVPEEPNPSLWRADGTANGTFRLSPEGVNVVDDLTVVGSLVFFVAADADDGEELWATDGSPTGTHRVADLQPGSRGSSPRELMAFQGNLYFTAMTLTDDRNVLRRELWRSDGTEAGTVLVKDTDRNAGKDPVSLTLHGGRLWFFALNSGNTSSFWSTDGTPAGTRPEAVQGGPGTVLDSPMIWDGDRVFFS
ncbi:MAG TPA: hypothetical protein VF173_17760, partial [Thermoanaerobaculia bacterium]|nr:hypothetical protein [Thermoanaerobaculia bacterium]